MDKVNERTSAVVGLTFNDENGTAVTPDFVRYKVTDESSGDVLQDWVQAVPTSNEYDIVVDQNCNRILDTDNEIEVRVVTVSVIYTNSRGTQQSTAESKYEVQRLNELPVGPELDDSGGGVSGGDSPFA